MTLRQVPVTAKHHNTLKQAITTDRQQVRPMFFVTKWSWGWQNSFRQHASLEFDYGVAHVDQILIRGPVIIIRTKHNITPRADPGIDQFNSWQRKRKGSPNIKKTTKKTEMDTFFDRCSEKQCTNLVVSAPLIISADFLPDNLLPSKREIQVVPKKKIFRSSGTYHREVQNRTVSIILYVEVGTNF